MRILILDIYRLLYKSTNKHAFSMGVTLTYITILNLVTLYGLGLLLKDSFSAAKIIIKLFSIRFLPITFILMFLMDLWIMTPLKHIKKEKKNPNSVWGLIMYTFLSVIIFTYVNYGDTLFPVTKTFKATPTKRK